MKMIIYRSSSLKNAIPLPIYLRATGWHTAKQGWTEENDGIERNYSGLFWCAEGNAEFTINNKKHCLKAGNTLYYFPYEPHFIKITSQHCTYYWVTFDGPLHVEILKSFKYPRSPFHVERSLKELFEKSFDLLHDLTPAGLQKGSRALYSLLTALGDRSQAPNAGQFNQKLTEKFVKLTEENFTNESYNVSGAAEILNVHRTTLGRALKEQLNISPNRYIINMRMQQALKMLYETNLKAWQIAAACGIPDPCYFSKLVKQLTGLPPHKLRHT
jgi:AraC-like DNA-binding protein